MECRHSFKLKTQTKIFDKKKFKFEAQTCTKCDLYIWDEKTHQVALDNWIIENKVKIKISFKYKDPIKDLIKELANSYDVDESEILETLLSLYIKYMRDQKKAEKFIKVYNAVDLKSQSVGEWQETNLRLTPNLYYKLKAASVHDGIESENFSDFVRKAIEIIISNFVYQVSKGKIK